jgi:ABC-type antimicrobial peptide transport system permease subunit
MVADLALLTLGGVIAGLACGVGLARFVRTLLFDVTPYDAASLLVPLLVLASAAIAAAVPPALRASRVDPIEALRDE